MSIDIYVTPRYATFVAIHGLRLGESLKRKWLVSDDHWGIFRPPPFRKRHGLPSRLIDANDLIDIANENLARVGAVQSRDRVERRRAYVAKTHGTAQ